MCLGLANLYISPIRRDPPKLKFYKRLSLPSGEPLWASPGLAAGKPKGKTLFVMVHGYGGTVGHYSSIGKALMAKGHDVLLAEMPAHGDSPDGRCGFGPREADLISQETRWARGQYATAPRVVLVGVSMGGSACWLAAGSHPELFDAVVTEGAFARLDETVDRWFDSRLPGGRYVFFPVKSFAARMAGVNPSKINPVEEAAKWKGKPALVIHCEDDALMPEANAKELAEAAGAQLWVIGGSEHAQGAGDAEREYVRRVLQFAASR